MTTFTRAELEREFEAYQERGRRAGQTGDWSPWADQFTEDAVYVEHLYGRFEGREAIRGWITVDDDPVPERPVHVVPVEWAMFDEARGWIVCEIQNRLNDLGDGEVYQAANLTKLHYAGDGHVELRGGRLQPRGDGRRREGVARQATGAQARLT